MKPRFFLMRHGDAGPHHEEDAKRPLSPKGVSEVQFAAKQLADRNKQPTAIIADGTTERTVQTARIMASKLGMSWRKDDRLSNSDGAMQVIADKGHNGKRPLLVTHDHVIGALTGDVTGKDWPGTGEIRRFHGNKEKGRITP